MPSLVSLSDFKFCHDLFYGSHPLFIIDTTWIYTDGGGRKGVLQYRGQVSDSQNYILTRMFCRILQVAKQSKIVLYASDQGGYDLKELWGLYPEVFDELLGGHPVVVEEIMGQLSDWNMVPPLALLTALHTSSLSLFDVKLFYRDSSSREVVVKLPSAFKME